jgi:hypothetical protein
MEPLTMSKLALDTGKGVMLGPNGETCLPTGKELEALGKKLEINDPTEVNDGSLLLTREEVEDMAPITVVKNGVFDISLLIENIPIAERSTSFFSDVAYKDLTINNSPDIEGVRIRVGDQSWDISLQKGDLLSKIGVANSISHGLDPALQNFLQIRFKELGLDHIQGQVGEGTSIPVTNRLDLGEIKKLIREGSVCVLVPPELAGNFLGHLETAFNKIKEVAGQGKEQIDKVLVAKRIDYLVGSQYIPGKVTNLPLVGGISNLVFKNKLDIKIDNQDLGKLGEDVFMVISIAALPLAPVAGATAILGWIGANATFGAVSYGAISHLNGNPENQALKDAGKGALLGAINGVAAVAVVAKLAPAISNKLASSAVSGAVLGGTGGGTETTLRVIGKDMDLSEKAEEIAGGILIGTLGGAAIGTATHGLAKLATKLNTESLTTRPVLTPSAKKFEKFRRSIEPEIPADRALHGGDIWNFSKQLDTQSQGFVANLYATDAAFANRVDRVGAKLSEALATKDLTAITKLERQISRDLSGYLAEAKVKAIFEPYFEKITTQMRVLDGTTIIDMVAEGAKHPIALNRHRYVEKGGSLPIEVKAGTERYFLSEIKSGHLLKQVGGHGEFGKGLVVTTRDLTNEMIKTGGSRETLRVAGSSIYRLLPPKADLDRSIEHLLKGEFGKALEDWAKFNTTPPWRRHDGLPDGAIT